eukprot:g5076.t2
MACADQQMMPGGTAPSAPMAAMAPCFMTQVEMPMAGMIVSDAWTRHLDVKGGSSASTAVPDGGQSSTSWSGWSEWTPNHWDWSTDATSGNMQTQNGNWKEERPKVGFKTKICGYYVEGSCPKGADCTFAHGAHELHLGGQRHDRHEDSQGEREVPNGKETGEDPETKKGDAAKVSDQSKAQTEGKDAEKRMKPCVYFAKGSCNKGVPQRQTASAFAVELCFGKPVAKAEAAPEAAKKRRKRRRIEAASQPTTEPGSWKPKAKVAAKAKVPSRYQRELKAYEEAQAAKAAAEKQREEDKRERNRKKKQTAKERAMTGKLLAKRNPKGQPSMRNLIEMVTSKLEATTASSSTQAKSARGFGRQPMAADLSVGSPVFIHGLVSEQGQALNLKRGEVVAAEDAGRLGVAVAGDSPKRLKRMNLLSAHRMEDSGFIISKEQVVMLAYGLEHLTLYLVWRKLTSLRCFLSVQGRVVAKSLAQQKASRLDAASCDVGLGRVLFAGGCRRHPQLCARDDFFKSAELYDCLTDTWQQLPPMTTRRHGATACQLDGKKSLVQHLIDLVNSGKTLICLSDACIKGNVNRGHVSRCRHIAQYLVELGADRSLIVRMAGGINAWKRAQLDGILGELRPIPSQESEDEALPEISPAKGAGGGYVAALSEEAALAVGQQIEISGLKTRAELNGKAAIDFVADSGRWEIELLDETKERLRCKPESLLLKSAKQETPKAVEPAEVEVRTTGELFVGASGGIWAELDVTAGEKKGPTF